MPRYIDAEKLLTNENIHFLPASCGKARGKTFVFVENLENAPTEDVVPRSEVEKAKQDVLREVFEKLGVYISQEVTIDLKEEAENYRQVIKEFAEIEINRAKQEVAREIFEEIEKILKTHEKYLYCNPSLTYVYEMITNLKKKYIGE